MSRHFLRWSCVRPPTTLQLPLYFWPSASSRLVVSAHFLIPHISGSPSWTRLYSRVHLAAIPPFVSALRGLSVFTRGLQERYHRCPPLKPALRGVSGDKVKHNVFKRWQWGVDPGDKKTPKKHPVCVLRSISKLTQINDTHASLPERLPSIQAFTVPVVSGQ